MMEDNMIKERLKLKIATLTALEKQIKNTCYVRNEKQIDRKKEMLLKEIEELKRCLNE